jgi:CRP-like cAMP-binding protein
LSENSEKEQGGWTHSHAPLSLRRQEIADLLGITRETVARILSSFQREGLIALHGRRCEILALDRLRRLVGATAPSVTKITSRV